jgi:hypothetical protein
MCRFHVAPRVEETIWVTLEINAGPLYECKVRGSPNQGIMSLIRWVEATSADSPIVRKASTHPEKVSTRVNRYLSFLWVSMWIKLTCQSSPGIQPQEVWGWF